MMKIGKAICPFFVLLIAASAHAQDYVPMAKPDAGNPINPPLLAPSPTQPSTPLEGAEQPAKAAPANNQIDYQPPTGDIYTCTSPPSLASLKTNITNKAMTSQQALKLGLPVGGLSAKADAQVFVQDWTRSKPCLSTDGKTQLLYGQALRIVASISEMEAGVDVNLATIAAQATLKNRASNIEAVVIGIPDQSVQIDAASLLGPIDVSNYAAKSTLAADLAKRAIASNSGKAEFLGIVTTEMSFTSQIASAFAVQQIYDLKSCIMAKSMISDRTAAEIEAVGVAYNSIVGSCDAAKPSSLAKATAASYLNGIKIKKN